MKTVTLFCSAVALVLGLAGCGTTSTTRRADALAPESADQTAFLLASIGVKSRGENLSQFGSNRLHYRLAGTEQAGVIEFANNELFPSPIAFRTEQSKGGIAVIDLKPGTYELHSVDFYYNNGQVEKSFASQQPFSVSFTLAAGEALYLGEFLAETVSGRNFLGMKIPAGGRFRRNDQRDRDVPLMLAAHPELAAYPIRYADMTQSAPPYVLLTSE